jgi:trimethylamine---corrinoid protein Co-methyltransferase
VLGHAHTRKHARDGIRRTIMNRAPYETWRSLGGRDLAATATARVAELLDSYEPPDDLDPVVRRQLDTYCLG